MKFYTPWKERTKIKRSSEQKVPMILVGKRWKHYRDNGKFYRKFYCMISHSRFIFNTVFAKPYR